MTLHSIRHRKCNCNYTTRITLITPQLQLHYATATTTAALHHTTSSSCGWGDRPGDHCNDCNHSKKHNSNHLSVHQWTRCAIRDSQQPTSPIGFLFLKLPPPPCAVLLVYQVPSLGFSILFRSSYFARKNERKKEKERERVRERERERESARERERERERGRKGHRKWQVECRVYFFRLGLRCGLVVVNAASKCLVHLLHFQAWTRLG